MALAHFAAGQYADSVTWARKAIEIHSEYRIALWVLAAALALQAEKSAAAEELAALLHLRPNFSLALARENTAFTAEIRERFLEGLRTAGLPEQ